MVPASWCVRGEDIMATVSSSSLGGCVRPDFAEVNVSVLGNLAYAVLVKKIRTCDERRSV